MIVHEYGHAVHQSQVPGYGQSADAGAIGESFGDYLAVTVGLDAAAEFGWPVAADPACPMDWDATSYTDAPHCIRSFDADLRRTVTGGVHFRSQVWARRSGRSAVGYVALGKTTRAWDTTLIDSQFDYAPDTSFSAAAEATYDTALARDGQRRRERRSRSASPRAASPSEPLTR